MSAAPARVTPDEPGPAARRAPTEGHSAPRGLSLVPRGRMPAARTPFVLLVVGLLVVWLLTLLALNTALAQMSFHAYDLGQDNRDLLVREQTLQQQVQEATSPAALAVAARSQGMVPGEQPAFLDLATGTVLGSASEAEPPPSDTEEGADPAETDADQTDADQTDADQTDADQTDADQTDADQTVADQTDADQTDADRTDGGGGETDQAEETDPDTAGTDSADSTGTSGETG